MISGQKKHLFRSDQIMGLLTIDVEGTFKVLNIDHGCAIAHVRWNRVSDAPVTRRAMHLWTFHVEMAKSFLLGAVSSLLPSASLFLQLLTHRTSCFSHVY
jgi:hypothetical protein